MANTKWAKYQERIGHRGSVETSLGGKGDYFGNTSSSKETSINGNTSRMSPSNVLPKPYVVRIEVMDGKARRAYMGGNFYSALDAIRESLTETMNAANAQKAGKNATNVDIFQPFYGIIDLSQFNEIGISVNARWQDASRGSGFSQAQKLLTGQPGSGGGLIGIFPKFGNSISKSIGYVANGIETLAQTAMGMSGVNNSSTGSTTIKKFGGASIECNLPIKCTWYLPKQENMCRIALKRLMAMTYVRPMNSDGSDIVNAVIQGIKNGTITQTEMDSVKETASTTSNEAASDLRNAQSWWEDAANNRSNAAQQNFKDGNDAFAQVGASSTNMSVKNLSDDASNVGKGVGSYTMGGLNYAAAGGSTALGAVDGAGASIASNSGGIVSKIKELAKKGVENSIDGYNSINTFFGGEITANPLPVRVTIGHYLDLEPMVITNLDIKMSKEQFISDDGTHLPIYITATIQLKYWMQPGPTKDFMSILGNEMFEEFIDRTADSGDSQSSTKKGGK